MTGLRGWLEEVMAYQRPEALGKLPIRADDLLHRRGEVVVDDPLGHASEMGEGPDVGIQKRELVGALVRAINLVPPSITHPKKSRPR